MRQRLAAVASAPGGNGDGDGDDSHRRETRGDATEANHGRGSTDFDTVRVSEDLLDHMGAPQAEEDFLAYLDRFQAKTKRLAAAPGHSGKTPNLA